ncbi:MAG: prepilin-type N-terminal cleavage/methylation domain-containing protein [Candidatus Nanopelagicales bacterium]
MIAARRTSDDRGVTLIEMLVVVSILGTVLAIVTEGLIVSQRTMSQNAYRLDGLSQSNVAMEAVTKVLRTAILPSQLQASFDGTDDEAAFIEGEANRVKFYANIDNDGPAPSSGTMTTYGPRLVQYRLVGGELVEWVQMPNEHAPNDFDYQYCGFENPGCPKRERVLARNVLSDKPLFTYYDRENKELRPPLGDQARKSIDSIDVWLQVRPSDRVDAVSVTARVTLPNADSLIQPTPTALP